MGVKRVMCLIYDRWFGRSLDIFTIYEFRCSRAESQTANTSLNILTPDYKEVLRL